MKSLLTVPSIVAMWVLAAVATAGELTVTISDIREAKGFLMVALVNSDAAWNNKDKPVAARKVAAAQGEVKLQFKDLAPGTYAVQVMHDENGNDQLDTNFLGIPTEGYGFSNNPNVMRRAHYDEARFDVGVDPADITIRLR
jgi:uncharacterized protein (DUF2141 family)